ncbi:hypothetical protein [Methylovirgula sp. HY1]|uniref:hypothetical protein n=1 Tax=Methylovirgula sp. HY1 TaxID=2822761 RepID=UPI001C5AD437|nr:hypothetical protein [Methylovirgula sp. HY1]
MPIIALARMRYAAYGQDQFHETHHHLPDLKAPLLLARPVAGNRPLPCQNSPIGISRRLIANCVAANGRKLSDESMILRSWQTFPEQALAPDLAISERRPLVVVPRAQATILRQFAKGKRREQRP